MKRTLFILATATCLSTAAFAAPNGFDNNQTSAVPGFAQNQVERQLSDVIKNAYDDEIVTVRGRLTKQLNKDLYEFVSEGNTKIVVELDDDKPWTHIAKDQLILITGEVDRDANNIKIDVKQATPITR